MGISEKIAYLKGLMEGMNVDTESNEGKLFAASWTCSMRSPSRSRT